MLGFKLTIVFRWYLEKSSVWLVLLCQVKYPPANTKYDKYDIDYLHNNMKCWIKPCHIVYLKMGHEFCWQYDYNEVCWESMLNHIMGSRSLIAREHEDVINWKQFPRYWPFVGEFASHRWIHLTKASYTELWYFLRSTPEQTAEQIIETPVIRDAIALIMTSLWWDLTIFHLLFCYFQQLKCRDISSAITPLIKLNDVLCSKCIARNSWKPSKIRMGHI